MPSDFWSHRHSLKVFISSPMSEVYHTEPATSGKVLLKTSYGDIDVELWSKEAPLACRNFVQLCMEGYYDKCPVHRVIKDFMVQTGDPTGTGTGGESVYGKEFKDEVHGRIKFNHRGQVAMANTGKPNSNGSQFFITFGECGWLHKKHTIFGKVTGNTVFNLMRLNDVEVDASDRPVEAIEIKGTEVIWNPFDNIVPRVVQSGVVAGVGSVEEKKRARKRARKATKDDKLLSFGDEEEEGGRDDTLLVKKKMHSSHDSKFASKKLSSKTVHIPGLERIKAHEHHSESVLNPHEDADGPSRDESSVDIDVSRDPMSAFEARMRAKMSGRLNDNSNNKKSSSSAAVSAPSPPIVSSESSKAGSADKDKSETGAVRVAKTKLKLGKTKRSEDKDKTGPSLLEQRRAHYKKKRVEGAEERESATLAKLGAFTASLKSTGAAAK